jgi:hypothetical protein
VTARLAALLRWGTVAASVVMAVGTLSFWTPWRSAAPAVILAATLLFAALPVAGLVLIAAGHLRRRNLLHVAITATVLALVAVDAVVGGLLT